jgi:hypothetical protein
LSVTTPSSRSAPNQSLPSVAKLKSFMRYSFSCRGLCGK